MFWVIAIIKQLSILMIIRIDLMRLLLINKVRVYRYTCRTCILEL